MSTPQVAQSRPAGGSTRRSLLAVALVAGVAALLAVGWGQDSREPPTPLPPRDLSGLAQTELEQIAGVRIVRLAVTGAGGLVDVRFLVVDPEKALAVHDKDDPPAIVDERTGTTIDRQWMAHSSPTTMRLGGTYYLLFVNPADLIRPGSAVTVMLGGARVENIRVS